MKKLQTSPTRSTKPTSILTLFARGREIGFVILERGRISRYGIKTIRGKKKQGPDLIRRVERVLAPVLAMGGPHSVVIERDANPSRKGALYRAVHRLSEQWRRWGCQVVSVPWKVVKEKLCERQKATHREVIRAVVQRHTLLWPLIRRSAVQAGYWKKVFLAAALGDAAYRQWEQKSLSQRSGCRNRRVRSLQGSPDGQRQR